MVALDSLVAYTDELLGSAGFEDYCPNGLQVQGRAEVVRLVSGVTASAALLDAALAAQADAILVHHGYFWRGESARITGIKRSRLRRLLANDVSLLAYHLPLDAHRELGNNVQLARQLELRVEGVVERGASAGLLWHGRPANALTAADFAEHLRARLARECVLIGEPGQTIARLAWCTGAAQGLIEEAQTLQVDAFLSGEISEQTVHFAREAGLVYFAAGHHATERYGVQALGMHLAEKFAIEHRFIDIHNPV
ncbi:MAG: Nif3-like dinuclear metal center hexameric protein [Gammaproteobacteria bacterium]|nr:Nif3-like dinuclear metal center hexameric protein [Gammaproteobacteria bacterium]